MFFLTFLLYLFIYGMGRTHVTGQRTICKNGFSPSIMCILGLELRSLALVASAVIHLTSPAKFFLLICSMCFLSFNGTFLKNKCFKI